MDSQDTQPTTPDMPSTELPIQLDPQTELVIDQKLDLTSGLAQGDVFFVNSKGKIKRLSVGTSGMYLQSGGANADPIWAAPTIQSNLFAFMENISAGDAVFACPSFTTANSDDFMRDILTSEGGNGFGVTALGSDSNAAQQIAQSFSLAETMTLTSVAIRVNKANTSTTDNVVIAIQADSAGVPSGSDLATATLAASSILVISYDVYKLTLSTSVSISASTTYWIVFRRSGSLDDNNNYGAYGSTANLYAGGSCKGLRGAGPTWQSMTSADLFFGLNPTLTTGIARTRTVNTNTAPKYNFQSFIGFAPSAITNGSTGNVIISGVATGLSGLRVGRFYYLSDTAGAIALTNGTNTRKCGIALSTTTLLIVNETSTSPVY